MANTLKLPTRDVVDQRRQRFSGKYQNQDEVAGYTVGAYEYPEDLRVAPDKQHYIAFYVLAREKSELGQQAIKEKRTINQRSITQDLRDDRFLGQNRFTSEQVGQGLEFVKENAGTLAGLGVLLKDIPQSKGITDIATAGVKAAGVGAVTQFGVNFVDKTLEKYRIGEEIFDAGTTVRLKDVITLHREERPSVRYSVNYNTKDLGAITGAIVQGSAAGMSAGKQFLGEGFARALSELIKMPGVLGNTTLADLRELSTSTRTNPFRQVMFESVDYRTFNFRYNFYPRSVNESNKVKEIIELFKQHMHPQLSENKFFHIYPSEFEIRYMYKTKENPYLNKIAQCALTDMQVDYGGDQFATFENGAPVQIGLTLTFRELEQLDSKRIVQNDF